MTTGDFDPNVPLDDFRPSGSFNDFNPSGGFGATTPRGGFETPNAPTGGFEAPMAPFANLHPPAPSGGFEPASTAYEGFDPNAPVERGYHPTEKFGGGPAGVGIRFAARLIDGVVCVIVALVVAAMIQLSDNGVVEMIVLGLVTYFYFVVFEGVMGWTPGKKLLGLSVHGPRGARKPTLGQAAARNRFLLWLVIPYIGFLLLIIPCILDAVSIVNNVDGKSRFDMRAGGTQVIKD